MKRFLQLVLWFLLGTIVGLPVGMYWMNRGFVRHTQSLGMMAEGATVDFYAKAQYRYADHESARQALLYSIKTLDRLKSDSPRRDPSMMLDLSYCYGELSLLEESAGNTDLANQYMAKAVEILKDGGVKGQHASEAFIRGKLRNEPFVEATHSGKPQ